MTAQDLGAFDTRLAKALSHPLRAHVLMILNDRVASPNEIAQLIEAPLPNVSYHVRVLRDLGWIKLVRTAQRRGFTEHYYRALEGPFFSDSEWASIPIQARGAMSEITLSTVQAEIREALDSGSFEARTDRYLIRAPFELDEDGWREINDLAGRFFAEAQRLAERSRQRVADGDEIRTRLVLMHFEMPSSGET
jgi:DNA-binding transcriptional ArsR family regulator